MFIVSIKSPHQFPCRRGALVQKLVPFPPPPLAPFPARQDLRQRAPRSAAPVAHEPHHIHNLRRNPRQQLLDAGSDGVRVEDEAVVGDAVGQRPVVGSPVAAVGDFGGGIGSGSHGGHGSKGDAFEGGGSRRLGEAVSSVSAISFASSPSGGSVSTGLPVEELSDRQGAPVVVVPRPNLSRRHGLCESKVEEHDLPSTLVEGGAMGRWSRMLQQGRCIGGGVVAALLGDEGVDRWGKSAIFAFSGDGVLVFCGAGNSLGSVGIGAPTGSPVVFIGGSAATGTPVSSSGGKDGGGSAMVVGIFGNL